MIYTRIIAGLTTSFLAISLSAESIDIKEGWNLFGAPTAIELNKFDNSCVDYILKYNVDTDTKLGWQHYIANGEFYNYEGTEISSIKEGDGFWVMASSDCSIEINDLDFTPILDGTPTIISEQFSIEEDNKFIGYLTSTSTNVTYSITDGDDLSLFKIDSTTGKLELNDISNFEVPIDFGANNQYSIIATVTDVTNSELTSNKEIVIDVTNKDDSFRFLSEGVFNLKGLIYRMFYYTPTFIDGSGDITLEATITGFDGEDYSSSATITNDLIKVYTAGAGNYYLKIKATDSAGNIAIQEFPFYIQDGYDAVVSDAQTGEVTDLEVEYNKLKSLPFNMSATLTGVYATYEIVQNPSNGTIEQYPDGTWWYLPNYNYTGTDSFTYKIASVGQDNNGNEILTDANEQTVTLNVLPKAQ